jgi:hypothetical protein
LKVPPDVRRAVTAELVVKDTAQQNTVKRKAVDKIIIEEEDKGRAKTVCIQQTMRHKTIEASEVDSALSDFFDGLGIAHEKINSQLAKTMFAKVMNAPHDWKLPSASTLRGNLLKAQYEVNQDERKSALEHDGVEKFGLTATTDGATIQKSPLLNFILMCVVWPNGAARGGQGGG